MRHASSAAVVEPPDRRGVLPPRDSRHDADPPRAAAAAVERILSRVAADVGQDRFERYFRNQARVGVCEGRLDVTVPTGFVADLIGRRFGESLRRAANAEFGTDKHPVEVRFRIDRGAFAEAQAACTHAEPAGGAPIGVSNLSPRARPAAEPAEASRVSRPRAAGATRYRLEDFVVGEANKLAFSAAERVADPGEARAFCPLFIHGACGLGKTHLLQGIAARWRERDARATIRCLSAEQFTNEYVAAVRAGRLDAFRKSYRGVDLLCIDDVQFLTNKNSTQGELLHTFDAIDLDGARVVLASDEHPRQIARLSAALVSRFMSGMIVRLDPPEPALRERIAVALAERRGLRLDRSAAACLASEVAAAGGTSVRDIEGALTRVEALVRLLPPGDAGAAVGVGLVRRALGAGANGITGHAIPAGPRKPIRLETIRDEVCRGLRVDPSDLLGRGRHKRVVLARTIISHLARALTTMSYPEIARGMGRPNHSTIVTACKRIEGQIARGDSPDLAGGDAAPELVGLTLGALCEALKASVLRSAWGAGGNSGGHPGGHGGGA